MQTTLSSAQFQEVRKALLGPHSDELIDLIYSLNMHLPLGAKAALAIEAAVDLGWVTAGPRPQLSPLGWFVADPIREYRLWLDRDRRIHGERVDDLLVPERYAHKSVLEVGSGFGCNLLSLSRRAQGHFVGVEPMAIYRQFTSMLAEREGMEAPEIRAGRGEALPFESKSFDIVLCYSAHQYMDIRKAIREMARVLVPGGQLQLIGGTLPLYIAHVGKRLIRHPSPSLVYTGMRTVLNTFSYRWLGRRVWVPSSAFTTVAPIYPSYGAMHRWFTEADLILRGGPVKRVGDETCFIADKPDHPSARP